MRAPMRRPAGPRPEASGYIHPGSAPGVPRSAPVVTTGEPGCSDPVPGCRGDCIPAAGRSAAGGTRTTRTGAATHSDPGRARLSYILAYEVTARGRAVILRVLHSARDLPSLLGGDQISDTG